MIAERTVNPNLVDDWQRMHVLYCGFHVNFFVFFSFER